eukprot:SAG31_NODE_4616_length_3094_cov_1.782638_5_plen_170_part_00
MLSECAYAAAYRAFQMLNTAGDQRLPVTVTGQAAPTVPITVFATTHSAGSAVGSKGLQLFATNFYPVSIQGIATLILLMLQIVGVNRIVVRLFLTSRKLVLQNTQNFPTQQLWRSPSRIFPQQSRPHSEHRFHSAINGTHLIACVSRWLFRLTTNRLFRVRLRAHEFSL